VRRPLFGGFEGSSVRDRQIAPCVGVAKIGPSARQALRLLLVKGDFVPLKSVSSFHPRTDIIAVLDFTSALNDPRPGLSASEPSLKQQIWISKNRDQRLVC
jgi:hypothetical protein